MAQEVNIEKLSEKQQIIYKEFQRIYPQFQGPLKVLYLKSVHLSAHYQIALDRSDDSLLKALPPEPLKPTAAQIAIHFYKTAPLSDDIFKILLPFIIYDFANPQSGRLPQCSQSDDRLLNPFEKKIASTRECIESQDNPDICQKLILQEMAITHNDNTDDQIIIPAREFLGITDSTDLN